MKNHITTIRQYATTLLLGVAVSAAVFALAGAAYVQLFAQAANQGSPPMVGSIQFFDNNGDPLTSGTVSTYVTATGTSAVTYSDRALNTRNANPVSLDSAGRASIFLSSTQLYRFILADSANVVQFTADGVSGANYVAEEHALDLSCGGKMTGVTSVPVSADVANVTTIYFTPYQSNRCALYDGTNWRPVLFTEASLSLGTDAANTNYDLYAYLSGSTLTLERLAWTNNDDRTTNLAFQNGVRVKSGDATRRWLGTYRTTATIGQTEDTVERRLISNRLEVCVPRLMRVLETTNSWSYQINNYRQANAASNNLLAFVTGDTRLVTGTVRSHASTVSPGGAVSYVAIGDGTTSAAMSQGFASVNATTNETRAFLSHAQQFARVGARTWVWLERASSSATTTWFGDDANADLLQSGIFGEVCN